MTIDSSAAVVVTASHYNSLACEPVREIREELIKQHADRRFRSECDYARFEYYRSAKVLAVLERAGVEIQGRVLDAGCGGGGMPLSLAEHAAFVVGIDPIDRFSD